MHKIQWNGSGYARQLLCGKRATERIVEPATRLGGLMSEQGGELSVSKPVEIFLLYGCLDLNSRRPGGQVGRLIVLIEMVSLRVSAPGTRLAE